MVLCLFYKISLLCHCSPPHQHCVYFTWCLERFMLLDRQRGIGVARADLLFLSHIAHLASQSERTDGTAELCSQVKPRYTCRSLIWMFKTIIWVWMLSFFFSQGLIGHNQYFCVWLYSGFARWSACCRVADIKGNAFYWFYINNSCGVLRPAICYLK